MSEIVLERKRSGWDVIFGILLIIGGLVILLNASIATQVSVLFIGWMTLALGLILGIGSLFSIGKGGTFWGMIVSGLLLIVLGVMILRYTNAAAVTLTLLAGFMFLTGGLVRLAVASQAPGHRAVLIISGIASVILGLIVLFNLVEASGKLLGILIGIEILIDGLTLIVVGRLRVSYNEAPTGARA